ncbi:MAG: hypothetical protein P8N76_07940 [Pirellulaceae bacterium]|nr:hypothetical protein [Pirellulaceae bacterium]
MPDPLLYLKAMIAASIVSAITMLTMVKLRRSASQTWLNSAAVLAIGLGLTVGYSVLAFRWIWPPANGLDRFLTLVIPAVLAIELIAGFQQIPTWTAWVLRIILAGTIPRILLHGSVYLNSEMTDSAAWQLGTVLALCVALAVGLWWLLSWLSVRSPSISISMTVSLATQGAGLAIMLSGYIKGGAAAFPLVATVITTTIMAQLLTWHIREPTRLVSPTASLGIGLVSLCSLLLIGCFFGRLSTSSALVILLAPLLCWMTEFSPLRQLNPWLAGSIQIALVTIPLLGVLAVEKHQFDREMLPLLSIVRIQDGLPHSRN